MTYDPIRDQITVDVTAAGCQSVRPMFHLDGLEARDVAWEDRNGRVPADADYDWTAMRPVLAEVFTLPVAGARVAVAA